MTDWTRTPGHLPVLQGLGSTNVYERVVARMPALSTSVTTLAEVRAMWQV